MTEQEWTDFLARTEGHTPGPLTIKTAGNGDNAVVSFDIDENRRLAIVAETFAGIRSHDEDARQEAKANAELYAASPALLAEVARLREALNKYANPGIYAPHPHGPAFDDRDLSWIARAALKGGEA
jgi:hypothetical protein